METLVFCIEVLLLVVTLAVVASGDPLPSNLASPGDPVRTNLALRKTTWQSSTYPYKSPTSNKAVDGNSNSNFHRKSCTHTNRDWSPWWTVDLGRVHTVAEVVITNRGDCCAVRLSDFTVAVGNDFYPATNFDPRSFQECVHVPGQLGSGETRILECQEGIEGRYVTIYLNNRNFLTLCEVEVYEVRRQVPKNLALHRATWQSSTNGNMPTSNKAVDGDKSTDYDFKSCTHTNLENNPWWVVDLAEEYPVTEVVITNRGDCCGERLSDFSVSVGQTFNPVSFDPNSFTKCAYVSGQLAAGETRALACHQPIVGRYVTIFLNNRNYLTLCEVEVHRVHPAGNS